MDTVKFLSWKRGVFRHGKEIRSLRGGVHRYAAQASQQIEAAMAEKNRFRTKTRYQAILDTESHPEETKDLELYQYLSSSNLKAFNPVPAIIRLGGQHLYPRPSTRKPEIDFSNELL